MHSKHPLCHIFNASTSLMDVAYEVHWCWSQTRANNAIGGQKIISMHHIWSECILCDWSKHSSHACLEALHCDRVNSWQMYWQSHRQHHFGYHTTSHVYMVNARILHPYVGPSKWIHMHWCSSIISPIHSPEPSVAFITTNNKVPGFVSEFV